jgi:hypothetical protein
MARKYVLDTHPLVWYLESLGSQVALLTKDPNIAASALVSIVW